MTDYRLEWSGVWIDHHVNICLQPRNEMF